MLAGTVYLICLFLFIPFSIIDAMVRRDGLTNGTPHPHDELALFLAGCMSIMCMVLLGFADDVLNLRWRHKLLLPALASIPILMVYYVNAGLTSIVIPIPLRPWLGRIVDLGRTDA